MARVYTRLFFLILTTVSLVSCYCPKEKIHAIHAGLCSFRIQCIGNIRGVSFPEHCQGSTNFPVNVDLELTNAIERFDPHINETEFLRSVTTFRVSANWPTTSLSLLKYMPLLRNLFLVGNQIKKISGEPFYTLSRLEILDLSHNSLKNISDLFQFESHPNQLRKLSLADNDIEDITGEAFEELTSLIDLDLSNNRISDLNEEPFTNLTSLEILRLNNNAIKNLNGALNNLRNLKHLYLRHNQIQNIDEPSLNVVLHLATFDISGNQLNKLKPIILLRHWKHFGGTCKIILSGNQITSIPNGNLTELLDRYTRESSDSKNHKVKVETQLDLSNNAIEKIQYNAFRYVIQMISLDLSHNRLEIFRVNPKDLEHVKYLNLSRNYFTDLYFESFSSMINLQNLDLSHNKLNYLPDETFTNNYNLKHVNMTFNGIRELERLPIKMFHPEGGVLDLSNNGLSRLYIPSDDGLRLTILILHSNNISGAEFVNLIYQNDLKTLEMSRNFIQELNASSLRLPLSLTSLNMGHNEIQKIGPSSFHLVKHLQSLFLDHNNLKSIEYGAFQGLTALSNLDLSCNDIRYLDSKVLMDLKSLKVLALRNNGLQSMDYNGWLGHKLDLKVFVDGNPLSCDWLSQALQDYNNGYSKMRLTILRVRVATVNTLEGIPCVQKDGIEKSGKLRAEFSPNYMLADERLLVINQKILEAVVEQTHYLRKFQYFIDKFDRNSVKVNEKSRQMQALYSEF